MNRHKDGPYFLATYKYPTKGHREIECLSRQKHSRIGYVCRGLAQEQAVTVPGFLGFLVLDASRFHLAEFQRALLMLHAACCMVSSWIAIPQYTIAVFVLNKSSGSRRIRFATFTPTGWRRGSSGSFFAGSQGSCFNAWFCLSNKCGDTIHVTY